MNLPYALLVFCWALIIDLMITINNAASISILIARFDQIIENALCKCAIVTNPLQACVYHKLILILYFDPILVLIYFMSVPYINILLLQYSWI